MKHAKMAMCKTIHRKLKIINRVNETAADFLPAAVLFTLFLPVPPSPANPQRTAWKYESCSQCG